MEIELAWHFPVIFYLFLAGVGAGAVTVSASILLRSGSGDSTGQHYTLARYGALIGPIPVIIGTMLIVLELGRPFRMLNLFKLINLSPMSVGSWLLFLFILSSLLYALAFLPKLMSALPNLKQRLPMIREILTWVNVPLGIGVAVYTGILLGAMPARPLWNSPILALLFLVSALSTGVAFILLTSTLCQFKKSASNIEKNFHESAYLLTSSDLLLIGFELMVIFLFIMFAHLTIGNVKYAISILLPGGEMALIFWIWVVLIGLLLPAVIELIYVVPKLLYKRDYAAPKSIEIMVSIAVLIGGFMLRYVIVIAGQITGPTGI